MDTKSNSFRSKKNKSSAISSRGRTTVSTTISSSSSNSERKNKKYTIIIPNPDDKGLTELKINIPSRADCKSPKKPNKQKVFCGKQESPVPYGYVRRGTTYECLRKGFGAGMCSIYKE